MLFSSIKAVILAQPESQYLSFGWFYTMMFSARARYALITAAVLTASVIQLFNGRRLLIVVIAAATFLFVGNMIVYLSGSKERAIRRKKEREYWAGNQ